MLVLKEVPDFELEKSEVDGGTHYRVRIKNSATSLVLLIAASESDAVELLNGIADRLRSLAPPQE